MQAATTTHPGNDTARPEFDQIPIPQALEILNADRAGLTNREAADRLARGGPNEITENQTSALAQFLSYFWGPIPWMIEVAAVLSAVVQHWSDTIIIAALLVFNAVVGYWQEHQAANAVDALKQQLALTARALRDGQWREIPARELVPGDIVRLRLGDIVPADVMGIEGDYLSVDQSALTGESLPVNKRPGEVAYSGSIAKQGEMVAVVTATGENTFFGNTARLVSEAGSTSHFQAAVLQIGNYLIMVSLALAALLLIVQLFRGASPMSLVQFVLILVVAAIPVAMPAVLSVTMAIGARALATMKAIVTRLESIEEMAGIDVLCSDKTGTLTQNRLTLGETTTFAAATTSDLVLAAALASKSEDHDPIDLAVIEAVDDPRRLDGHDRVSFIPFDPVGKRTEATFRSGTGIHRVTKGAPQVIRDLCVLSDAEKERVDRVVDGYAARGFRTLGVADSDSGGDWRFLGIVSLSDPPRDDSLHTIQEAKRHGIAVKMITGDNVAIARQISGELELGRDIAPAGAFFDDGHDADLAERVENADGFAEVFPEHKYDIVKALQRGGHIVGMTGDGVNDAPALKQADIGVAVQGATDAARAAADLVLTAPGLSVIVGAVEQARKIFERMNSYAIYRITETIRIMVFVVAAMIAFNFYPITAMMIILLAFFNDLPIMAIAYDETWLDPNPVRWNMHRVLSVSTVLGLIGVVETFGLLVVARQWLHLDLAQVQTFIFLKLAVAGHLTLFVARTRKPFLTSPHPAPVLLWSAVATKALATLLVVFGLGLVTPIPWVDVALVWGYCIAWVFLEDWAKLAVYRVLDPEAPHQHHWFGRLARSLLSFL